MAQRAAPGQRVYFGSKKNVPGTMPQVCWIYCRGNSNCHWIKLCMMIVGLVNDNLAGSSSQVLHAQNDDDK